MIKTWWNIIEKVLFIHIAVANNFLSLKSLVATELDAFRTRNGEENFEFIMKESIRINEPPDDNSSNIVINVHTSVRRNHL